MLVRQALKPQQYIIRLADLWQKQINRSFNAMHVRCGDYMHKCAAMRKECAKFGPDAFFQSSQRLRLALTQLWSPGLPVFVSTTHDQESEDILNGMPIDFWITGDCDVPSDLEWMRKRVDMLALTSQVLASRAEEFMANRFSSFSSEINHMRQLQNASARLMFF